MNNTIIAVIIIVILIGGGWWYYSSTQDGTGAEGPAGTMLEGSEVPDNGMVGGDAAMPVPGSDTEEMVVVREFNVVGTPFKFDVSSIRVKKGEHVRINFKNAEGMHDWVLDEFPGARTKILQAGQSESIEFVADKVGTFEYYCSVGQHRAAGMKGAFVVTE